MNLWHMTSDAPRLPHRVSSDETVQLHIGTWPIEPGQHVWVEFTIQTSCGPVQPGRVDATWRTNRGVNSYWDATLGPFQSGDRVRYMIFGSSSTGEALSPPQEFRVGPKLHLAIIWHHHQPIYKESNAEEQQGRYLLPWVRLHCLRDYYSMANLVRQHPAVHLTINLTPALVWQIEDYVNGSAMDIALELTLKPASQLSKAEREYVLSNFFDAHWHNQIFPHTRYKELFERRYNGQVFTAQDIRDLQMWFNLAWFAKEVREGEMHLVTGEAVSVRPFIEKGRGFDENDIREMVDRQYRIMRAVIPLHRHMQDAGQVEISTTPFFHPILPLVMDTDQASIDRPAAKLPARFSWPEDADAQVRLAVDAYREWFGQPPRGMWPAEGAVSQSAIPIFARHGVKWIASDEGVLARSGRYGYRTEDPGVLCQPYRAEEGDHQIAILFRSRSLSDAVGFHYHGYADYDQAASDFVNDLRGRYADPSSNDSTRLVTVILDGENAWGNYRDDARPFLEALYSTLERSPDIQCVTPSEYLAAHPIAELTKIYDLFTGSWIDRLGSAPGVDLDTWIGEEEKNRAWELLKFVRDDTDKIRGQAKRLAALRSVYMAEGSDWFWWFGSDHVSGNNEQFDDLFRTHLKNAYTAAGKTPPALLDQHITPHTVTWSFARQVQRVQRADRLAIQTNCPGVLTWTLDGQFSISKALTPAGGAMAGAQYYHLSFDSFPFGTKQIEFRFRCTHEDCSCTDLCCEQRPFVIDIVESDIRVTQSET